MPIPDGTIERLGLWEEEIGEELTRLEKKPSSTTADVRHSVKVMYRALVGGRVFSTRRIDEFGDIFCKSLQPDEKTPLLPGSCSDDEIFTFLQKRYQHLPTGTGLEATEQWTEVLIMWGTLAKTCRALLRATGMPDQEKTDHIHPLAFVPRVHTSQIHERVAETRELGKIVMQSTPIIARNTRSNTSALNDKVVRDHIRDLGERVKVAWEVEKREVTGLVVIEETPFTVADKDWSVHIGSHQATLASVSRTRLSRASIDYFAWKELWHEEKKNHFVSDNRSVAMRTLEYLLANYRLHVTDCQLDLWQSKPDPKPKK